MAHSENSNMIRRYIADFEAERITLSQLWYNIQTPLHLLFQKEELLQVQEERLKEVKSYNVMWQTEYKQKESALALFVKSFNSLKAEIVELKKQQEYWYVEKVAQEKKELALKAEISVLKNKLDALKKEGERKSIPTVHSGDYGCVAGAGADPLKEQVTDLKDKLDHCDAEKVEYEKKEIALKAEVTDLKNELDSLKELFLHNEEELTTNRDTLDQVCISCKK